MKILLIDDAVYFSILFLFFLKKNSFDTKVLKKDKKEKKDLIKRLKNEVKHYPKNAREYNKGVQHHTTIEPDT